jgi:hypothetical protein
MNISFHINKTKNEREKIIIHRKRKKKNYINAFIFIRLGSKFMIF